jgi:hypothetical protein
MQWGPLRWGSMFHLSLHSQNWVLGRAQWVLNKSLLTWTGYTKDTKAKWLNAIDLWQLILFSHILLIYAHSVFSHCCNCNLKFCLKISTHFLYKCGTGDWTQGFILAREAVYHLSHFPNFGYQHFCLRLPPHSWDRSTQHHARFICGDGGQQSC